MIRFAICSTLIALAALLPTSPAAAGPRVVAYVPNWIDLDSFADRIDYAKLTHINIAFENPRNMAGDMSFNRKDVGLIAKAHANGVKILVSMGGGSTNRTIIDRWAQLSSGTNAARFAGKLADYVSQHDFDGVDVDIEGPAINKDYGALIAELSKALKPKGKLLTAAVSKGYGGTKVPNSVFEHLDFVNIMAYDAAGPWDPKSPGQHSSLQFAKDNVAYWLARGLARSKAVLGVPFYGYGFSAAFRRGGYTYSTIVAAHPGAEAADQAGDTIWYNGISTIKAKAKYVVDEGLGGVMIWSLNQDAQGNRSLLSAIHETLASPAALKGTQKKRFRVLAFYPAETEDAHMSFVRQANKWFPEISRQEDFGYESTTDWSKLRADVLSQYEVVLFLDARPEKPDERAAFQQFMEKGGGWMGFHFAGFALTPSKFPQNWDWYHNQFLGAGSYVSNTWRPTSAVLRVEDRKHPATAGLPETFKSAPNEWYRWSNDLRKNPDIKILLSIDPSSFPLGTGPKPHEIWHEGYYPVVWTNTRYRMIYMNMGHNDIVAENKSGKEYSSTFGSQAQNKLILDSLLWLGRGGPIQ
jgi:GH18 family chitinase